MCITGATGHLGREMVPFLLSQGVELTCLVRNTHVLNVGKDVRLVKGDLCNEMSLKRFVKGQDICIHLAAQVASAEWLSYEKTNIYGTKNLCEAIIRNNKVCKLISMSSVTALNTELGSFYSSHYAKSKYLGDQIISDYSKNHGLHACIMYPGFIFGGYCDEFLLGMKKFLKGKITFFISSKNKRAPFTHTDALNHYVLEKMWQFPTHFTRFLVTHKINMSMKDVISYVANEAKLPVPKWTLPKWPVFFIAFLIDKISHIIGVTSPLSRRHVNALSISYPITNNDIIYDDFWQDDNTIISTIASEFHKLR